MLPHMITVQPYAGDSAFGPVKDDPTPIRARVDGRRRMVRTSTGETVIGSAVATIRPQATEIPTRSKVVHGSRTFEVLEVVTIEELRRPFAVELILSGQ